MIAHFSAMFMTPQYLQLRSGVGWGHRACKVLQTSVKYVA